MSEYHSTTFHDEVVACMNYIASDSRHHVIKHAKDAEYLMVVLKTEIFGIINTCINLEEVSLIFFYLKECREVPNGKKDIRNAMANLRFPNRATFYDEIMNFKPEKKQLNYDADTKEANLIAELREFFTEIWKTEE